MNSNLDYLMTVSRIDWKSNTTKISLLKLLNNGPRRYIMEFKYAA